MWPCWAATVPAVDGDEDHHGPGVVAKGEVHVRWPCASAAAPYRIARLVLGYLPENRRIFTELSVMENLAVACSLPRRDAAVSGPRTQLFALFPNLATMRERPGRAHVGRRAQMLTIAPTP